MSVYYTSLVTAILLGTVGQIALKSAAQGSPTVIAQFLNPLTMVGLAVYIVAALCYILAIKKIPISIARRATRWSRCWRTYYGTSLSDGRSWRASH